MTEPNAAAILPTGFLRPVQTPEVRSDRLRETAMAFEAAFLAQMLKPMFENLSTEAPFGGGQAEGTWRSFLVEAMAEQTVRAGGIGVADHVMAQMIRLQEVQS